MAQLSDMIERFIKELMEEDPHIEVRRNELAHHFGCAPSQINYVLATRFSVDHGYIIESRRGGGGYVRIVKMQKTSNGDLLHTMLQRIGSSVSEEQALALISFLQENELATAGEASLMAAAVAKNALALPISAKDVLRASILKSMVTQIFRNAEAAPYMRGQSAPMRREGGHEHDV